jgi:hypothetical protein
MSERVVELIRTLGSGDLEERLQDAAGRVGHGPLEQEDLVHLLHILTDGGLTMTSVFELLRIGDLVDADLRPTAFQTLVDAADDEATLHKLVGVPDQVRRLGDKCLFETGVARRQGPAGLDFEELGRRSYTRAARLLELLSQDRRLREHYDRNVVESLRLEDEIQLLQHWSEEFQDHVRLLHALLESDRSDLLAGSKPLTGPILAAAEKKPSGEKKSDAKGSGAVAEKTPLTPPPVADLDDEDDEDDDAGSDGPNRPRLADMQLVSRSEEEQEEKRFRELMAAEKTVLFSALDTEQLRDELKRVVIHQETAIDGMCDELALYSTGTQDPRKPASYFLIGPTGVGKNYLVESTLKLFEELWGIEVPYLELEGPAFTYPSDINELKGAARGFIRSDEEGIMTQFYNRSKDKPFSVILVDEVEKAHPQLRRFFLPIMDRGTIMDNRGKTLYFNNSMIFFTSNIGYSDQRQSSGPMGFGDEEARERAGQQDIEGQIRKGLAPEFVNRVHLIHFRHLTRSAVDEIFDLEMSKIRERYRNAQHLEVHVTDKAREELLGLGYNRDFGARNLSKVLNRWVNIEVSKVIKRDEERKMSDVSPALQLIRDMREGKRDFDAKEVASVVEDCSRIRVPYSRLTIDYRSDEFAYLRG